ncbi:MAG: hypothetical protein JWN46_3995 [Acidimicrobiales bacterium]|nr:hypothetical protein [Acidimicrobiales bacterium]
MGGGLCVTSVVIFRGSPQQKHSTAATLTAPVTSQLVHVEVQYTADCPNARAVLQRMKELADTRPDLTLRMTEVKPDSAVPKGFTGSPTVLIDGTNPFDGTQTDSAACALHPPSADQVEQAVKTT